MTEPPAESPPDSHVDSRSYYEKPAWKRLYAFILGPMLVAAAGIGLYVGIRLLTAQDESPAQLVQSLQNAGEHRRWQAAFELTRYLQPSIQSGPTLTPESNEAYREKLAKVRVYLPELLEIFENPKDLGTARYVALALGYLKDKRATSALVGAAKSPDTELAINSLVSLALLADPASVPGVIEASQSPHNEVRSVAAYVLGVLGERSRLHAMLTDPFAAVRWNAAFGLARIKDPAGETIIGEILDRGPLYETASLDGHKQREMFLNAIRSAGMVRSPKLLERLEIIAKNDEDLRARSAAMEALGMRE